ncbi:MAG TPA: patatin-like phospholipase family protein, partial [Azonexus sp.]
MPSPAPKSVAIACQGGGSHTAFTAGVLQELLHRIDPAGHRIMALSGTSGGALCAALAWNGLLAGDPADGIGRLKSFWQDMSAHQLPDVLANQWLVWLQRTSYFPRPPEISPYLLPAGGQDYLATIIRRHVDFAALPGLI